MQSITIFDDLIFYEIRYLSYTAYSKKKKSIIEFSVLV